MNNKLFYGAALACVLSAAPGFAQSTSDDVIVTATKRATSLQNTAVAVTPVSEEKLQTQNVVSISELTRVAPSLNFVPAPSNATTMFVIRGISTFAFNDALEQSVGLVLDGVPLSRLVGSVGDMVDVSQVQVLRGPQGTLFGKNATGGVVSVDTRDPNLTTKSFDGRVFYGSNEEKRFQGTVNLPLVEDKAALRVSGWKFSRDGYIDAPFQPKGKLGGFDNQGARVKVALQPTENWRVDVGSEYTNNHFDGSVQTTRGRVTNKATGLIFNGNTGLENAIQTIDRALGMVDGPDNLTSFKSGLDHSWSRQSRNTVKSFATFGNIDFTVIGGYIDTHQFQSQPTDYTNSNFVGTQCGALGFTANRCIGQPGLTVYRSDILQRTVEARIANNDDSALKYTAGLFYYDTNIATSSDAQSPLANTTNGSAIVRTARWPRLYQNTDTLAAFGDVSYTFGKAEAFGGLRYSYERSGGSFIRQPSAIFPGAQPATATETFLSVAAQPLQTYDLSYRAGLQYKVTDEVMIYASTNRAYKGPGFNFGPTLTAAQFAQNGAVVEKEVAKSYEIGARSRWFDRQLTLNLTGFYSPFTNFQVTAVLPTTPTSFASVNAPELVAQGIEAEFSIEPNALAGFALDGSVVWNDTHYGEFETAPCYTGQVNTGTAAASPGAGVCYTIAAGQPNAGATVQDVSGLRAVASPEWQVSLNPSYEYNLEQHRIFTSLHYLYTSDTQFGVNDNPDSIQKAYTTLDMTAGFGAADRRWTLTAYARNLTDERFSTRISVANPTINQSIPYQALQTYGVSLDVSF